ncbi:MAG TPA: SDR family NAD(P)-dependent oxidoreductase [Algoriphagus sp.]|nr:SDR family NAD(P)-dependent oxidoreductase [Algoriphagus sp.]
MDFWAQKRIWIIGASSGIGEGLVKVLAEKGAKLIISARNESKLHELQVVFNFSKIEVLTLDVENHASLPEKTGEAWQIFEGLDYVFLNAGMSVRDLVEESRLEVERKIMDINFWGPVAVTKELLKKKKPDSKLHLVITSSLSGKYGVPKLAAYAASKHAIQGYFDSLRAETFGSGLFIHIVIPGFIRTNITVAGMRGDGSQNGKMQNALAGGMDPEVCASGILRGLERGKEEFVVGGSERFTVPLNRFFPNMMKKLIRSNPLQRIKKIQKTLFGK